MSINSSSGASWFRTSWVRSSLVLVTLVAVGSLAFRITTRAEQAHVIPAPAADAAASGRTSEVAVFAGGCFWGVQGVFQHVKGVTRAVSGYAGGSKSGAKYEIVSSGSSGHAEVVQVTFDPRQVTYGQLMQVFFSVAHNPTELNRQGPDVGTQYRSAIFPTSDDQARLARAYIAQLDATRIFGTAIVTRIEAGREFYPAEDYHQDYLTLNPDQAYIAINDLPKIADLKRLFPAIYRDTPVLVNAR